MVYLKIMDNKGEIDITDLTYEGLCCIKYECEELLNEVLNKIEVEK